MDILLPFFSLVPKQEKFRCFFLISICLLAGGVAIFFADLVFQDIAKASQSSDGSRGQGKNARSGSGKSRSSSGSSSSNDSSNSSSNKGNSEGVAADEDEDDNEFYSKQSEDI
jgi:hypothetical protein